MCTAHDTAQRQVEEQLEDGAISAMRSPAQGSNERQRIHTSGRRAAAVTINSEEQEAPRANACLSRLQQVWMPQPAHALAACPDNEAEAKPAANATPESAPSHPSRRSEGVLAAISTMINDNLGFFR